MHNDGQARIVYDAGPQPGERQPAPGRLALVQAFVNSFYDLERERGVDLLRDPEALSRWLSRRGFDPGRVSRADHTRAIAVRRGLQALAAANNGGGLDEDAIRRLNDAARRASFGARLGAGDSELVPHAAGVDGALATILAITTTAMFDGTWLRLKACPGHDCGWAFFDHSRSATGSWCSMRVCGGRAKQRAYYRRARR